MHKYAAIYAIIFVLQLSKLALQALNNNQLVFAYEEIQAACPDIIATPKAINGFGLLQAVYTTFWPNRENNDI